MIANPKEKFKTFKTYYNDHFFFTGFAFDMFLLPDVNDSLSRYIGFVYIFLMAVLLFCVFVYRILIKQQINLN